ncbi:hypothetical protein [Halostagnicola kamekurae]|uniref:Uncharacterized protein n=1 Tax=Halostagnicola kamekurae TaxID=619731 RepID=A0A1I6PJD1_9EURY|nr:hypothetical protein [Halostagnicola kamekurae]SFS40314.1 hypothetical protein SAMN04488556_0600 [Halostagnicola kamekurae]
MPSDTDDSPRLRRRTVLATAGLVGLGGVGTVTGYRALSEEREDVELERTLTVDEAFDIDEDPPDPAPEEYEPDRSDGAFQQCEPNPDRLSSGSHTANLTMIDAWNERYRIWGDGGDSNTETNESDGNGSNVETGDIDDSDSSGIDVQNTISLEKASDRVDGSYLYGVRLYSLCGVESDRLERLRLRRLEHELAVDPAVEVRSVLPERPITPDSGQCQMGFSTELESGWAAGYEQHWPAGEGTITAEHDDAVTLSLEGSISDSAAMEGLLELRSERPLVEIGDVFTWTVRGEATRRGL